MEDLSKQQTELKKLHFLIGEWKTHGIVRATSTSAEIKITGSDTYQLLANDFFILHIVDVKIGDEKVDNVEVIYFDNETNSFPMQSFDNFGKTENMHAQLKDNVLLLSGDKIRSTLTINVEASEMNAFWERTEDGTKWIPWMDLKFNKSRS